MGEVSSINDNWRFTMEDGGIPPFLVCRRFSLGRCDEANARSSNSENVRSIISRRRIRWLKCWGRLFAQHRAGPSPILQLCAWLWARSSRLALQRQACAWRIGTNHRLDLLTQIIRMLLVIIPDQRGESLKEEEVAYGDLSVSEAAI